MRTCRTVACLAALALVGLAASPPELRAQTAGVPPILAGTFDHPDAMAGRATVLAALEPHIVMLPYFAQVLVRSRLDERLSIPRRIVVALEGEDVSVTYEGERTITIRCPLGGSTTITTRDGREVPVTQNLRLGWLEQVFTGESGTLTVMLSTEPDGRTLHADGTMRGERLPADVPVRLDYVRTP